MDRRVGRVNCRIDWDTDWPNPYRLSKHIRFFAYPVKKCWVGMEQALSTLRRSFLTLIRRPTPRDKAPGSVEAGEIELEEFGPKTEAESAKEMYRSKLLEMFGKGDLVELIMPTFSYWENGMWGNFNHDLCGTMHS